MLLVLVILETELILFARLRWLAASGSGDMDEPMSFSSSFLLEEDSGLAALAILCGGFRFLSGGAGRDLALVGLEGDEASAA